MRSCLNPNQASPVGAGGKRKEVQTLLPVGEKAELRNRLFKAFATGDPRVNETDIATFDAGRLPERAFRAVHEDADIVEPTDGRGFADAVCRATP